MPVDLSDMGMKPTRRQSLFIVSGAPGVGKTTACRLLFERETDYIVLNGDLLWDEVMDTPEDGYRRFRTTWMRIAASVAQVGLPVVLEGAGVPEQYEALPERALFTDIHYLALTCEEETLRARLEQGREIDDLPMIRDALHFNAWLRAHASTTVPPMTTLDTTGSTPAETANRLEAWIRHHLDGPSALT